MNGITKARVRSVMAQALRPVPTSLLLRGAQHGPSPVRRAAGVGLLGRRAKIVSGLGAGLTFNCGASNPAYLLGRNEQPIQDLFAAHVRPGHVVIDVGANVGFFTMLSARLTGAGGQVVAVEPEATNAAVIRENAAANGFAHVDVIEAAVGACTGEATLWLAAYAGGHALTTADRPPDARSQVVVPLVTIDDLVQRRLAPRPDLVKIDVEGGELVVLAGMEQTLRRDRPTLIVEIDDGDLDAFEAKWSRLAELLADHDYQIRRIDGAYTQPGWHVAHALAVAARPRDRSEHPVTP